GERAWSSRERKEESVALRINLDSPLGGTRLADQMTVLGERVCVHLGSERMSQERRALDIGEEEGDGAARNIHTHGLDHPPRKIVRPALQSLSGVGSLGWASVRECPL